MQKVRPIVRVGSRRSVPSVQTELSILTAGLVFLVALGSSRTVAVISSSRGLLDIRPIAGDLFVAVVGVILVVLCVLAYIIFGDVRRQRSGEQPPDRSGPAVPRWARILAALVPLAVLGSFIAAIALTREDTGATPGGFSLTSNLLIPDSGYLPPQDPANHDVHWWILATAASLGLIVLFLVMLSRRHRRSESRVEPGSPERGELRAVVEASLEALEQDGDPRRAVIHAYASMERVLSEHGVTRRPSEAPLEYLERWVGALRVDRSAAEALTGLYERARFSPHPIDDEMKQEVTASLLVLRGELEGGVP